MPFAPRRRASYRLAAFTHPAHFVAATSVTLLAIMLVAANAPLMLALAPLCAVETAVLAFVPRQAEFRASVDRAIAEAERAEAAAARALLAPLLRPEHRAELEALESTAGAIRAHAGVARLAEDWTGATDLVLLYGRVALAYKESIDVFTPEEGFLLAERVAQVERELTYADETTRGLLLRRRLVLRAREASFCTARARLAQLATELDTISDQLRAMREQCALADAPLLDPEIDLALDLAHDCGLSLRDMPADAELALALPAQAPQTSQ